MFKILDCILNNYNAPKNDLSGMPISAASAVECQVKCQRVAHCLYFTFESASGSCWLKTSSATAKIKEGFLSGPKYCGNQNIDFF